MGIQQRRLAKEYLWYSSAQYWSRELLVSLCTVLVGVFSCTVLLVGVFSCTVLVGVFSCMASALVSPSHDRMVVTSPRRGSALPQHSHKSTIWLLSSASIHIHLILQLSNTSIHSHHIQQLFDFYHLFPFILKMAIQIRKQIRLQIIHTCVDPEETS